MLSWCIENKELVGAVAACAIAVLKWVGEKQKKRVWLSLVKILVAAIEEGEKWAEEPEDKPVKTSVKAQEETMPKQTAQALRKILREMELRRAAVEAEKNKAQ